MAKFHDLEIFPFLKMQHSK